MEDLNSAIVGLERIKSEPSMPKINNDSKT